MNAPDAASLPNATPSGAWRQVRGQLDELCDVFRPILPITMTWASFERKAPGQLKASWIILRNGSAQLSQLTTSRPSAPWGRLRSNSLAPRGILEVACSPRGGTSVVASLPRAIHDLRRISSPSPSSSCTRNGRRFKIWEMGGGPYLGSVRQFEIRGTRSSS